MKFKDKLEKFKTERVGFHVDTKEVADELQKVFDKEKLVMHGGVMRRAWKTYGAEGGLYVSYNYFGAPGLGYGMYKGSGKNLNEILPLTLEELKAYNAPQALEDKLKLFKAGTHVLHTPTQEIYDKLMVELEKRGYVWASGHKPTEFNNFSISKHVNYSKRDSRLYGSPKLSNILMLTPEDFSTPQVITITSDGYRRVTAESNGVFAEALCNPTDTFDISKGSHIALKRLLEKLDEDTIEELGDLSGSTLDETEGFHVGDIVEVIGNEWGFTKNPVGLQ